VGDVSAYVHIGAASSRTTECADPAQPRAARLGNATRVSSRYSLISFSLPPAPFRLHTPVHEVLSRLANCHSLVCSIAHTANPVGTHRPDVHRKIRLRPFRSTSYWFYATLL
jgi:hypothetical protein